MEKENIKNNFDFETNYNHLKFEHRVYESWMNSNAFSPDSSSSNETFSIVMPPPNVTGKLHMGHALDITLQDILARFKRMCGFCVVWVPGMDHAGIATQIRVEEMLRREKNLTRYDLGREKFLSEVWNWKETFASNIRSQIMMLGASCDFKFEHFTMDEDCTSAVLESFIQLYDKDLIYKGNRIANFCTNCSTALSDTEVLHEEKNGKLFYVKYKLKDEDGFLTVATTRPETIFADVAVSVNPNDKRYKDLIGKFLLVPLENREIPIISDESVEEEFGTGCLKITPGHSQTDFEIGERHGLPKISIFDQNGNFTGSFKSYRSLNVKDLKERIVEDLSLNGFIEKTEEYKCPLSICYRCSCNIEPLISDQWFVKMKPFVKRAKEVVANKEIQFVPERFEKIYFNWLDKLDDWCISRQLWWGHQIPVYYCKKCGEVFVSKEKIFDCKKCQSAVTQDEDVLDTWFSSALWPFEVFGWPKDTEELNKFYPTSVLVTGYDIIFFWVSRMIFFGLFFTGKIPFEHVIIHGLVRDSSGKKMSKSLGNGIDPMDVINKYGADSLRYSLISGNSNGNDMRFYEEKVISGRNFINKIWNACRFVLFHIEKRGCESVLKLQPESLKTIILQTELSIYDKWILHYLIFTCREVTNNLNKFEMGIAIEKINDFFWNKFCDWYIEMTKIELYDEKCDCEKVFYVLTCVILNSLCLLHPFMPFVTEEIWGKFQTPHPLINSSWPKFDESFDFHREAEFLDEIISAVKTIRKTIKENEICDKKYGFKIFPKTAAFPFVERDFFVRLCNCKDVEILSRDIEPTTAKNFLCTMTSVMNCYIIRNAACSEKEVLLLKKEKENVEREIAWLNEKLSKEFVLRAPAAVVEEKRASLEKYKNLLDEINLKMSEF